MSDLRVSLLQSTLFWKDKAKNLGMFNPRIQSLKGKTDIAVLPEMFNTGFCMDAVELAEEMDGEVVKWMKNTAAENRLIVTGSVIIKEGTNYFNRLIWMLPDGNFGYYDKRHRFGFAGENNHFTAGNKRLIASVKGWKINLMVCYDLRFPVWIRQQGGGSADAEFDLLIVVANWPERRKHAWQTLLQARAIENQCYCIGVNRVGDDGNNIYHSGNSMVVDPLGEILYAKEYEEDTFTISLDRKYLDEVRTRFPFLKDRDNFSLY